MLSLSRLVVRLLGTWPLYFGLSLCLQGYELSVSYPRSMAAASLCLVVFAVQLKRLAIWLVGEIAKAVLWKFPRWVIWAGFKAMMSPTAECVPPGNKEEGGSPSTLLAARAKAEDSIARAVEVRGMLDQELRALERDLRELTEALAGQMEDDGAGAAGDGAAGAIAGARVRAAAGKSPQALNAAEAASAAGGPAGNPHLAK